MPVIWPVPRRPRIALLRSIILALGALLPASAPRAAAKAATLAFITQPGLAQANRPFGRQPTVVVLDQNGDKATDWADPVTLTLRPSPDAPGAMIAGSPSAVTANGVATFTDVSVNRIGRGFILTASSPGVPPVDSAPFSVTLTGPVSIPGDNVSTRSGGYSYIPAVADGQLGLIEWSGAGRYLLGTPEQDVIPGNSSGDRDYAGELLLLWTSTGMRFALTVTDDFVSFPPRANMDLWAGDGVEFFIGTAENLSPGRSSYSTPGDYQVIISATENPDGSLTPCWYSPQAPHIFNGATSAVAVVRTPTGYVMEGLLPLPGATPNTRTAIDFNVMAKDRDAPTPGEDSAFSLSGLPHSSTDPSAWTRACFDAPLPRPNYHFVREPIESNFKQGSPLGPIKVSLRDQNGIVTEFNEPVMFTLSKNATPGVFRLGTVAANGGYATTPTWTEFSLYYRAVVAECGGISGAFRFDLEQVVGHITCEEQPVSTPAGRPFVVQPYLHATDIYANTVRTVFEATVQIKPGTGTAGARLSGATVAAAGSIYPSEAPTTVRFTDLSIDTPGLGYVLLFTSGDATCESVPFDVLPGDVVIPQRPRARDNSEVPMAIDGSIGWSEWLGAVHLPMGLLPQDVLPGRWRGPADFTADVRLLWDNEGLRFAADMRDDVVSFPNTDPLDLWQRDGLEIFIGVGNTQDASRQSYDQPGDYHIMISADEGAGGNLAARWYSPQDPVRINGPTSHVAARRTEAGYVLEGIIPWSLLQPRMYPAAGRALSVNVVARDLDTAIPGPGSAFSLSWNPGSDTNPSRWLQARLADAKPTPVALSVHWEPEGPRAGIPFRPQPLLTALDGEGRPLGPLRSVPVSIVPDSGTVDATLLGTRISVDAPEPYSAAFADLAIDKAGVAYALRFGDSGLFVDSAPFNVLPVAFSMADVARALRIVGGLETGGLEDAAFFTSEGHGAVTLSDAAALALALSITNGTP